jgi:catechol 2,3-dioxygenase-like lactoylglutathione lyase family enzyme
MTGRGPGAQRLARALALLLPLVAAGASGAAVLPNDPLEPIASGAEVAAANTGPLSGAIVVTRDLEGIRRAYVDGMGLELQGPLALTPAAKRAQRRRWQMPAGLGGPSYSSLIVEDAAAMERFFTQLLDLERRTDCQWTIFSPRFRYLTLHAKGARTGNLGLVKYQPADRIGGTGVAPRPPHRGLAGWSFPVKRLDEVMATARRLGIPVVSRPLVHADPRFGRVRIATLLAPNGLLIEAFEQRR